MATPGKLDVGLDFGTTNSLLTYFDRSGAGLTPYLPQGADHLGVPTAVEGDQARDASSVTDRVIGWMALARSNVQRHFKVALGGWRGNTEDKQYRAANQFLSQLVANFRRDHPVGIGDIVVSVPDNWATDKESGGMALRKILEGVGLNASQMISEPVAAACYFAYRRTAPGETPFRGHVLVFDFGGGTLDLSLCAVNHTHIEAVHTMGVGLDQSKAGFGGVAYDLAVYTGLRQKHPALADLSRDAERRTRWLIEFEQLKRQYAVKIKQAIESPRASDYRDRRVFAVQGVDVTLADLVDVFDTHFLELIAEGLDRFLAASRRVAPTLDMRDPEHFCVLPVGGFSEFYPVQRMLRWYFGQARVSGTATVVDSRLQRDERWQAVSKGACLVAAKQVSLNRYPPFGFGLVSWRGEEMVHNEIISAKTPLVDYLEPRMLEKTFVTGDLEGVDRPRIQFYIEHAGIRSYAPVMPHPLQATLPEFGRVKEWRFGATVRNGFVHIEIQGQRDDRPFGKRRTIRLGRFFNLSDGTLEAEDQ